MKTHVITLALAALLVILAAAPADAQDIMGGGITSSWSSTQLLLNSEKKAWAAPECVDDTRWATTCESSPPTRPAQPDRNVDNAPAVSEAALSFRPSLEGRQRNFARFVNKSRAANPAGAEELRAFLAQDVIGFVGKEVASRGLRTDNVADAMTIYVMEAWEAANASPMPPSRARSQAVRRQMLRAIEAAPALVPTDDATKQEVAEAMMVQAVIASNAIQLALKKGDPKEIAAVQDMVRQGALTTVGLDLRNMSMTEEGLREGRSSTKK